MHYTAGRHLYAHTGATAYTLTILGYIHVTAKEELSISSVNPLTPNDPYRGRTAPLTSKRCILCIYSTNIVIEYFKYDIYSPFFFSSKCSLFHNSNIFCSCIIHILYTGFAKIKKKNPAKKVNMGYTVLQKRKIKLMRNALISPHFLNVQNVLI